MSNVEHLKRGVLEERDEELAKTESEARRRYFRQILPRFRNLIEYFGGYLRTYEFVGSVKSNSCTPDSDIDVFLSKSDNQSLYEYNLLCRASYLALEKLIQENVNGLKYRIELWTITDVSTNN